MRKGLLKTLAAGLLGVVFAVTQTGTVSAQVTDTDRPAPRQDVRDTNDMDWGWIGLIGLAGLLGLMGRDRRRNDYPATTTTGRTGAHT